MLKIRPAAAADIEPLRELARTVWHATYASIISRAQIDYMLADRYGAALIRAQLDDPLHAWRLACWRGETIGFAHARIDDNICKLDKLYVHPAYQRRGIGQDLLNEVKAFARQHHAAKLRLQVNRRNTAAIAAYRRYGFMMLEARVFDIGGGFVMDDYVMEAPL